MFSHKTGGRLFHTAGPLYAKLRCPVEVWTRGSRMQRVDADRSHGRPRTSSTGTQSASMSEQRRWHTSTRLRVYIFLIYICALHVLTCMLLYIALWLPEDWQRLFVFVYHTPVTSSIRFIKRQGGPIPNTTFASPFIFWAVHSTEIVCDLCNIETLIFPDRISESGDAIVSVRLSVYPFVFALSLNGVTFEMGNTETSCTSIRLSFFTFEMGKTETSR